MLLPKLLLFGLFISVIKARSSKSSSWASSSSSSSSDSSDSSDSTQCRVQHDSSNIEIFEESEECTIFFTRRGPPEGVCECVYDSVTDTYVSSKWVCTADFDDGMGNVYDKGERFEYTYTSDDLSSSSSSSSSDDDNLDYYSMADGLCRCDGDGTLLLTIGEPNTGVNDCDYYECITEDVGSDCTQCIPDVKVYTDGVCGEGSFFTFARPFFVCELNLEENGIGNNCEIENEDTCKLSYNAIGDSFSFTCFIDELNNNKRTLGQLSYTSTDCTGEGILITAGPAAPIVDGEEACFGPPGPNQVCGCVEINSCCD